MKKLLLALILLILPTFAHATCNGQFSNGQICGVASGGPQIPGPVAFSSFLGFLPLTQNHIYVGNASNIATDVAMSQDCTIVASGVITCLKTNNVAFTAIATTAPGTGVVTALGVNTNASGGIITATPTRAGDVIFWNGSAWTTLAGNNSGTTFLSENGSGVPSWTTSGSVSSVVCNGVTINSSGTCPPAYSFVNCSITASVASNNLTVALKDNTGSDPSASSPCNVYFRNTTLATGSWTQVTTTGALSFTANSGSTFGITNTTSTCPGAASCPFRLWVVGMNSGSGLVLGVVALSNASNILPINESGLTTSTACNACASATTLGTFYSTAAQTSKPIIILGYLEWGSGLGTAGQYASAPTIIQTMGPGVKKPGDVVQQTIGLSTSPSSANANTYTLSGTLPTTGNSVSCVAAPAITGTSAVNHVRVEGVMIGGNTANTTVYGFVHDGTTTLTIGAASLGGGAAIGSIPLFFEGLISTSAKTYTLYTIGATASSCNAQAGNTTTIWSGAGTISNLRIQEIMG